MTCGFIAGLVLKGDSMSDSQETTEAEERQIAEMVQSVDRYHGEMRRWRGRRLLRWTVAGVGGLLLLSALAWATGAAAASALGGLIGFASTGGPSAIEQALFNLQQAGKAVTYASLFALTGILVMTELSKRVQSGSAPEPPDALRTLGDDDEEQGTGTHDEWKPPSPE